MNITKLLATAFLYLIPSQLISQSAHHLELLHPGDIVERNGSTYTIENNEFQSIREFAKIGPTNGSLVLYGGGDLSSGVLKEFEDRIGGTGEKIVAITTAACWAEIFEADDEYLSYLASYGFTNIEVLHTRDASIADSQEFSEALVGARGIWIGGGGPECLLAPYLHTNFHNSLRAFLNDGGVIAGTSAGAIVLGSYYQANHGEPVRVGRIEFEGFEFIRNVTIAAHIDTYPVGFSEQVTSVIDNYYPGLLGIGIEENTAVIVERDTLTVSGSGVAKIYDGQSIKTIRTGESYDLARRR